MKKIFLVCSLFVTINVFAQNAAVDTNFITGVIDLNWMPNGKALLLDLGKFDKTRKTPPVFKSFIYSLASNKMEPLDIQGTGLAASPDGEKIAFPKLKENNKADIYIYDLITKQQSALVVDTFRKSSPCWSPDGKKIVFTHESGGQGPNGVIDIFVIDIATKQITQVTESGKYKSYNPVWSPEGNNIVYYFEKGDNHDQIWLTDSKGSFHTNLTNDTTTHNYYPSWIDKNTIIYTSAATMTINTDGTNKQKADGVSNLSFMIKYNTTAKQAAYVTRRPESKLMLFDWEKKTNTVLLETTKLSEFFK